MGLGERRNKDQSPYGPHEIPPCLLCGGYGCEGLCWVSGDDAQETHARLATAETTLTAVERFCYAQADAARTALSEERGTVYRLCADMLRVIGRPPQPDHILAHTECWPIRD